MLLIKNVKVFQDGHERHVNILTAGGHIVAMGPGIDCNFNETTVLDGRSMTAIPGYIDQHVHIAGGGGEGGFSNQVPPIKISDAVRAGVTTMVGLLGTDGISRSVEGLVAKAKALKEEGLTVYCLTGSYDYPSPTITDSVRKDIAFIQEIIGVKIAISDHRSSGITKDEMVRLASEARIGGLLSGKPGIVHMHTGRGKDGLKMIFDILETCDIPISIFRPTHVGKILNDAIRFAKLGGYIDITAGTSPERTAQIITKLLEEAPIDLITLSSDGNGSIPVWNEKAEMIGIKAGSLSADHDVIKALVTNHDMPLQKAIKMLTENPAKALGIYPHKGTLQVESDADIVFLDENNDIDTVIAGGRVLMSEKKMILKGKFEN